MSAGPPSSRHRHLARQLRKLGLEDEASPPDAKVSAPGLALAAAIRSRMEPMPVPG